MKRRPAVILTTTEEIARDEELVAVVCSHSHANITPLPEDYVQIPYDASGRARTGLKLKTVAICSWITRILKVNVREDDLRGVVQQRIFEVILDKVVDIDF